MGRPKKAAGPAKPPMRMWGFRMTESALAFLRETALRERRPQSVVALRCIEDVRDARAELGPEWFELERQASLESVSAGAMLGKIVRAALEKGKRK